VKILAASGPGEVRVAAWDAAGLVDYAIWRPGLPDGVGDVHRGRVVARMPALAGAFVAIDGADGFLPDSEGGAEAAAQAGEGAMLGVRVTRAAQGGKGPRLTARLSPEDSALAGAAGPVALLRRGPGAVERLAALYPDAPVIVDDAALVADLRGVLGARLRHGEAFDDEVESAVAALGDSVAMLPGGARLSVHPTPALTALDVDLAGLSAERRGKTASQMAANRALLPALARQIRLRNLAGAILVDLAGLSTKRRAGLGADLAAALATDPLRPRFLGFSALGLVEILRPRIHPPLHEMLAGPHAAGLAALRQAAADIAANPVRALVLHAAPAVAAALAADPVALKALADRAGRPMIVREDRALPALGWTLKDLPRG
jgi:Ribonuclease G/E